MDLTTARGTLVLEARDLLSSMESALLEMEAQGASDEAINAVFRAAHTIKGSAGLFGLDLIVSFAHVMESVLDRVRNNTLTLSAELSALLLLCGDYLGHLIDAVEAGQDSADPNPASRQTLLAQLQQYLDGTVATATPQAATERLPADVPLAQVERDEPAATVSSEFWHISLRFDRDMFKNGMDPISFIQYLQTLGRIVHIFTLTNDLPSAEEMDPETCYLGFEIDIDTDASKEALESVFEFVREDSRIRILPPHAKIDEYIALITSQPETEQMLGEILLAGGTLTRAELHEMLVLQEKIAEQGQGKPRLGELLVQEEIVQPSVVAAALSKQKSADDKRSQEQRFVKVEASKLDHLINLVGELVVASAGARLLAERTRQNTLVEALGDVGKLVDQIRDGALNLRMIAIGEVFQRFPRIVRDVSQELGKRIDLEITGAETELDKSMVEKLSDPLLHIVRNAVDHGIESIEQRIAAGKPEQGKLHLHAYHESGCIIIEVSDDGRGLDTARIRAKAIEKGLIAPEAELSEQEIHMLIFHPGFSTAETVTNLSGRGVGMDVVKRNIDQLRGEIDILSIPGEGATMRLRLPLTLAIIDGFQVSLGGSVFVIPLDMVVECADISEPTGGQRIINLRGEPLPYLRLREAFELPPLAEGQRENLVVVEYGHRRAGLVVDQLLGEFQAVIKPLSHICRGLHSISGSTILGDGSVALILDIPALVNMSLETRDAAPAATRV